MKHPRRQIKVRGARSASPIPLLLLSVLVSNPAVQKVIRVQAVLDSGCTRTLINPELAEALEIDMEPLPKLSGLPRWMVSSRQAETLLTAPFRYI